MDQIGQPYACSCSGVSPLCHERSPIPRVGVVAQPYWFRAVDSLREAAQEFGNLWALTEFEIAIAFRLRAKAADGAKMEGPVAAASKVLHRRHGRPAKLAFSGRTLGHLPLGALRDPAFS